MDKNSGKKQIFEPIKLNNLTLKNRLLRSATWEGIAAEDGSINEKIYSIYEEVSKGGIGGIITGFTSVSSSDVYFDGMMRLSDDKLIPQYKKLTDIFHEEKIPILSQIALGAYYKNSFEVEIDDMNEIDVKNVINLFINGKSKKNKF